MRAVLTGDQLSLAHAVRELLDKECTPEALRAAWDSETGRVPGLWRRLADLGAVGITVPEAYGGLGLGVVEAALVLEEAGRHALPEPLLGASLAGAALSGSDAPLAVEWLPQLASGGAVVTVAGSGFVHDAGWADLFLLVRGGAVVVVPADELGDVAEPTVDRGVRVSRVDERLVGNPVTGVDPGRLAALGALGVAAQLVGLAQGLLDQAVDYAKQREQFGKPIGTFQSVKHALADVYVDLAFARPVVLHAAATADLQGPSAARDASHAKLAATKAARHAARAALQVHGAIGYTFEHELHMWLKRLWTLTPLWGTEAEHREILARPAPTR